MDRDSETTHIFATISPPFEASGAGENTLLVQEATKKDDKPPDFVALSQLLDILCCLCTCWFKN
jgi:hypothetical protein